MLRDQPRPALHATHALDLPRIWLFTDARNDAQLGRAIDRLPRGSGIVFRHYHLRGAARRARFDAIRKLARRRGHVLLLAGPPALARRWRADGVHGRLVRRSGKAGQLHSAPVHNMPEIRQANRVGADIVFLSPVSATRSHPDGQPLGPLRLRRLSALCEAAVILLGGMDSSRYRARKNRHTHGWAAIDSLSGTELMNESRNV